MGLCLTLCVNIAPLLSHITHPADVPRSHNMYMDMCHSVAWRVHHDHHARARAPYHACQALACTCRGSWRYLQLNETPNAMHHLLALYRHVSSCVKLAARSRALPPTSSLLTASPTRHASACAQSRAPRRRRRRRLCRGHRWLGERRNEADKRALNSLGEECVRDDARVEHVAARRPLWPEPLQPRVQVGTRRDDRA